ncbi:GTPase Era [Candidatus Magnetoovum chiemensis]|nr:GTPase Era [Candidatus Magnetoovum chiemensis]
MTKAAEFHSGFVTIIGRPNVGKSTLLNILVQQKVSIVTSKPQTTRNVLKGVRTFDNGQIVFIDTPGIHKPNHRLGEIIIKSALDSLESVDIVYFVVEPKKAKDNDLNIIKILKNAQKPCFLLINKIDTIKKQALLPIIKEYSDMFEFKEIMPICALNEINIDLLCQKTIEYLPEGPKYYPDDIITDQIERFMVSEIVREKVMELTHEEIPHASAVEILRWRHGDNGVIAIEANIYIEKDSQRGIIIGKEGTMIQKIGSLARKDIEELLDSRVYLNLFVKVRRNWRKDTKVLRELGFN